MATPIKTRMKRVTEFDIKRRRAAQSRKTRQQMVNLRDQIDRWKIIFEDNKCQNDGEVAELLIDSYLMNHSAINNLVIKTEPLDTFSADDDNQRFTSWEHQASGDKQYGYTNQTGHAYRESNLSREPENLVMDCETENDMDNKTKPRSYLPAPRSRVAAYQQREVFGQPRYVDFHSIHGLPVNVPFILQYSSPSIDEVVDSKVYIIVEHSDTITHPFKMDVIGDIHEIASGGFNSKIFRDVSKSNMSSCVDITNRRGLIHGSVPGGSFPLNDYDGGETDIQVQSNKGSEGKLEIIADILNGIIDSVVKHEGGENRTRKKRNGGRGSQTSRKKQKLIKLEDSKNKDVPHSSRIRSKGYRINYAKLNELNPSSDLSEMSDFEDELNVGYDSSPYEIDDDSITSNDTNRIKKLDPDYRPADLIENITEESSTKKSKGKKKIEKNPDLLSVELDKNNSDKPNEMSGDSIPALDADQVNKSFVEKESSLDKKELYKEKLARERQLKKMIRQSSRITVILSEHTDKFYIEDHVSVEMKHRGKTDLEKTFQLMVCAECKKFRTEDKRLMESHLEYHINGDLSCKKCDFKASALHEMRMHMHDIHNKMRKCLRCSTVDNPVTFKNNNDYKEHYIENHKDYLHQCVHCGFYHLTRQLLRSHRCAGKGPIPDIQCDICGKELKAYSLPNHKKNVHFNVRSFPCSQCTYSARSRPRLLEHVQAKHEGIHNHKCDICDFTCVRQSQLVSHQRTHTGYKPYKCDQCPYAAAWNVQLKEHKKLHDGMAPLSRQCEVCGVVVKEGASYTKHLKKEHGEDGSNSNAPVSEQIHAGIAQW